MDELFGNSMGNLAGKGLIAGDETEVFLALPGGLVRLREGEAELMYAGDCTHLNLTEDYLYFVDERSKIVELPRQGGAPYVLAEKTGHRYDEINHMVLHGEFLYYSVYWGGSVYRLNLEGGEQDFLFHATCLSLSVDETSLYFSDEPSGVVQRLGLEELNHLLELPKVRLAEMWFEQHELPQRDLPDFLRRGMAEKIDLSILLEPDVLNDWDGCYSIQEADGMVLYLACGEDEDEETACTLQALNPETGEAVELLEDPVDCFNLTDDWILLRKTEDGCLYRMPYGGSESKLLSEEIDEIYIVADRIWCTHPDGSKITRLYADGSGREVIRIEN